MSAINFRNKQIFYRVEGCGKPVILLHGFGEDGNIWNNQIEALKQDHQLIIPDLPGSGQSEILEGDCEIEDYTEVVKALADKEISGNSYKDFTLIGHSMGGYISLAFAKKYPGLLNALGLFHSSAFADNEEKIKVRKKNIEFIEKNGAKPFLKSTIPNLFSKNTKGSHPEMVQELISLSENLSPEALIQYTKAMIRREDTTSVLKSFPKPILFIVGIHDEAVPLEASLNQCYLPKIAQVNFLQKSGHLGMWEQQELATKFLKGFLTFADSFG
jgi:pimeloyl-ACP methyl ester carboxylesterase